MAPWIPHVTRGDWLLPMRSRLKPAASAGLVPAHKKGTGFVLCLCHPTPANFLGLLSAQIMMEQHRLSFAPLYLQGALQLQGVPFYLSSLSILFSPVTDDGVLNHLALQESTGAAATAWKAHPLNCRASPGGSHRPAVWQRHLDPGAKSLLQLLTAPILATCFSHPIWGCSGLWVAPCAPRSSPG